MVVVVRVVGDVLGVLGADWLGLDLELFGLAGAAGLRVHVHALHGHNGTLDTKACGGHRGGEFREVHVFSRFRFHHHGFGCQRHMTFLVSLWVVECFRIGI